MGLPEHTSCNPERGPQAFEQCRKLWLHSSDAAVPVRKIPKRTSAPQRLWRLFCLRAPAESDELVELEMHNHKCVGANGAGTLVSASEVSGTEGSAEVEVSQRSAPTSKPRTMLPHRKRRRLRQEIASMLETSTETFTFSEPIPLSLLVEVLVESREVSTASDTRFQPLELLH
jgi:hypothetical protein